MAADDLELAREIGSLFAQVEMKAKQLADDLELAREIGSLKEGIDEDDPKLRHLWIEYGDDVCNAVKTALIEINEYNPNGRYAVCELWNYKKNRKAMLKEVLRYIFSQMETTGKRSRR